MPVAKRCRTSRIELSRARRVDPLKKWQCILCGFIYDEAAGIPDEGITPGIRWEDVAADWTCPGCGAPKSDFDMIAISG